MAHPRRSSSEHEHSSPPALAPPRPFFLADAQTNRSSNSSFDTTSLDPASDSDSPPELPLKPTHHPPTAAAAYHTRTPRKRSSMSPVVYSPDEQAPKLQDSAAEDASLYASALLQRNRPPPSSFTFPFQAHPGNPDPSLSMPGVSRSRASLDSDLGESPAASASGADTTYHPHPLAHSGSLTDLRKPMAPFMAHSPESASSTGTLPRSASSNSLYKQSVAANMSLFAAVATQESPAGTLPRTPSTPSFRAPFLAPSSRPTSSFWSPPAYNAQLVPSSPGPVPVTSPNASTTALGLPLSPYAAAVATLKCKPPLPSTRLTAPLTPSDKPWLDTRERGTRRSYFLTLLLSLLGLAGAAVLCYRGIADVRLLDEGSLCQVLNEQFASDELDESVWTRDVELGGFGNGQFEMTTADPDNLFVRNGQLYLVPTLTSDKVDNVLDGGSYTRPGCTAARTNSTACSATSSAARGTALNPVMSARISTQGKRSIQFGRVEVRAKLPQGDWLWPAIWMLPEDSAYGPWPASGEIDILEARGNGLAYPAQGANYVRSSLNYGPLPGVLNQIFGWWSSKRTPFSADFHTYTLEWDPQFVRVFVDKRTRAMLEVDIGRGRKKSFWDKAGFPLTAQNGSAQVVVTNPYASAGASDAAPYDQKFYLIMNLAAGGTSGWFPDGKGGKPWFDGSLTAMRDFALAQDTWSKTWPASVDDRAFRIDYVKMWEKC